MMILVVEESIPATRDESGPDRQFGGSVERSVPAVYHLFPTKLTYHLFPSGSVSGKPTML